ncbi:universal stress protein [Haliangium ochraceum]|uniref:UspA domain protein n=1 Tax=Haliangium ochraceum (strain DSM 14365 / JCM 11303 / SMP-2) TaxID=502025 RepID=D0LHR7_HALO1|nr:universal stress protein [Haliangium ochraceum]ACY12929.1 UspA domain protein [Haliangium ochraceum DSM 14365]
MSTILFATDFSEASEVAGHVTRAVARHLQARVICAHAVVATEAQPDAYELASGHVEDFRKSFQEDLAARHARIEQFAEELGRYGLSASSRMLDGSVIESICEAADEAQAALVILGSHGRTGLKRFVLGSVAERVVRLCSTSVLVARAPVIDQQGFRRVLVPTDFSEAAEVALDQAASLAAADASIDILHCWQPEEFPDGLIHRTEDAKVHDNLGKQVQDRANSLGNALVRRVAIGKRKVRFHWQHSRPGAGIHEFIEQQAEPYDLIGVGTHGRTGINRLLVGSVAESTVRYAPCSVLVARPRV